MLVKLKSSVERPAWSSESSTGMFNAHKHRHRASADGPVQAHYYGHTCGFQNRRQASELFERAKR